MAILSASKGSIYYEVHGDGDQTLIFLNGIMMSTMSWGAFIDYFKKDYTFVLVDFYDQGRSDYLEGEVYTQEIQVDVVKTLIEKLALKNITLMGISYGGEIAMQFALAHQEMIDRLILANTTAYTNKQLKTIGESWIIAAETLDGKTFFKATIPPIYSSRFYETHYDWLCAREALFVESLTEKWYKGFIRLVKSAESLDVVSELHRIKCPVMVIGADQDMVTPAFCQEALVKGISHAEYIVIKDSGHASMYEKPMTFAAIVDGFARSGSTEFNVL